MDVEQNVNNLIRDIGKNTNLVLTFYKHNDGYMLEIYKFFNDASDEILELLIKRYDDLSGHYKYLRGMYTTIKMVQFKDLEISRVK